MPYDHDHPPPSLGRMCCRQSRTGPCTPAGAAPWAGRGAGQRTARRWAGQRTRPRTPAAEKIHNYSSRWGLVGTPHRLLVVVTLLDERPPAHPERVVVGLGSLHDAALLHEHVLALLPHVVLVSEIMQCGNSEKKTLSIRASNDGYITFKTLC